MSNKKRIFSGILSAAMACGMLASTASAAGISEDDEAMYKWVRKGDAVYLYDKQTNEPERGITWFNDETYYLDNYGKVKTNLWGTDIEGNTYYFGKDGRAVTNGIYTIGKHAYCFDVVGVLQHGLVKFNGNYYYFMKDTGRMVSGLVQMVDDIYYFDKTNGRMQTGWVSVSGTLRYFGNDGKMFRNCTKIINGTAYTFNEKGISIIK